MLLHDQFTFHDYFRTNKSHFIIILESIHFHVLSVFKSDCIDRLRRVANELCALLLDSSSNYDGNFWQLEVFLVIKTTSYKQGPC